MILKVFYKKFYKQRYIKFKKLNPYMKQAFKKILIDKKIYIKQFDNYLNQRLANFIFKK